MKKLLYVSMLFLAFQGYSGDTGLDLRNGDVLRCLVNAARNDGWQIVSIYDNPRGKRVIVFSKGKRFKRYIGRN